MDNRHPTTPHGPNDLKRKQQARVHEYRATALDDPDPLSANVAAITSDLMDKARQLSTRLDGAMAGGIDHVDDLPQIERAFNIYLRVTRQIQSFVQLIRQRANERGEAPREGA